jgi:hypothetical protein
MYPVRYVRKNPHHLVPAAPSKQGYEELTTAVVEDCPLGVRMELWRVFNRRYGRLEMTWSGIKGFGFTRFQRRIIV